jgi:hypothetical protein
MTDRRIGFPVTAAAMVALALALALSPSAAAQAPMQAAPSQAPAYKAPRTSFGHPSLEGVWTANFILPMEASPIAASLTLPEAEAKAVFRRMISAYANQPRFALDPEVAEAPKLLDGFALVRGERRTRAVVAPADGRLPMTSEARKEMSARKPDPAPADNPEERSLAERCIILSPAPAAATMPINPRLFVQTPAHIVLHNEYGNEARIIPFGATHDAGLLPSRLGNSIARWEGETLVIETTGLIADERVHSNPALIVGAGSKVIERFTRISENELLLQYTVEDPSIYTAPWLAEYSLYRTDTRQFEFACHEGNYGLPNMLRGQRVTDARR